MVVKSATKKRLMDLGIPGDVAHAVSDDRKIDDVLSLSLSGLMQIAGVSETDALQIYRRIRFRQAIIEYFRTDPVSGGPRLVAYANPLSSLIHRFGRFPCVINRRITSVDPHDYDRVWSIYRPKLSVLKVDRNLWHLVNQPTAWHESYYEDWVQRNSMREVTQRYEDYYDTGVLGK